jgi:alkylhydroperoxidase family enzyme
VHALRDAGLDDRGIHDLAAVAAYFNFVNRLASGLGVDLEEGMGR